MIEIDGQPWFVAADVANALSISNPRREVIKNLSEEEKRSMKLQNSRGRANVLISESGLYKLVMRSDKPEAQQFRNWVTREVLPAIRKDGGYILGEEKPRGYAVARLAYDKRSLYQIQKEQRSVSMISRAASTSSSCAPTKRRLKR